MTDGKPTAADVVEFVGRGVRAQTAVDALAIGARLGIVRKALDDAAAHRAERRHTNAAALEQVARRELAALTAELATHFERFAR